MIRLNKVLQFERQILASTLLVYHALIWSTLAPNMHFALSFILYGLFLLWQPLWGKQASIAKPTTLFAATLFILLTAYFPDEIAILFGLILSGLIGSRLLSQPSFRSFDLLALLIIIIEMVVGVVPDAFDEIIIPAGFSSHMQTIVLIPILLFFFAPNPDLKKPQRSQVDLMHGLLSASLIFVVLLGGIVSNLLYRVEYIDGLLLSVFIISTLTFGISWFWNPGVGYSGVGVLWNRYTLTIGGPFETWINTLTTLIEERYLTPIDFLEAACERLVENDWLNAIQWNFASFKITAGEKTGNRQQKALNNEVSVDLYFKSNPGAALEQHTLLLIRMAYQFYLAKLNQEKMRAQEHIATIHHTGARLTHDIRNILQSIKASLDILKTTGDSQKKQSLLQENLTQISWRLENTLEKLNVPRLDTQIHLLDCHQWMERLEARHQNNDRLNFQRDIENNILVPVDLFDSVVENLLNNSLRKKSAERITISLFSAPSIIVLSVCDDGKAVEKGIEADLFRQPVSSGSGMGIGLYQSAIMARAFNFELELGENKAGRVCFNLVQHLSDETDP